MISVEHEDIYISEQVPVSLASGGNFLYGNQVLVQTSLHDSLFWAAFSEGRSLCRIIEWSSCTCCRDVAGLVSSSFPQESSGQGQSNHTEMQQSPSFRCRCFRLRGPYISCIHFSQVINAPKHAVGYDCLPCSKFGREFCSGVIYKDSSNRTSSFEGEGKPVVCKARTPYLLRLVSKV